VITQTLNKQPVRPRPTRIQGIGAGFIPDTLDLSMIDRMEQVSDEESIEMARRLSSEEGILSGISCGAAVSAAVKLAKQEQFQGKTIVVILPDSGERYLSTILFEGMFEQ
jgi:cysteine synthase A